jgi:hypothetical protein
MVPNSECARALVLASDICRRSKLFSYFHRNSCCPCVAFVQRKKPDHGGKGVNADKVWTKEVREICKRNQKGRGKS